MASARDLIIIKYGGSGGVDSLDMGLDVLGIPFVFVGAAAAGIEADYELFEVQRKDKAAVGGAAVGVELLGIELVSDTVAPGIAYLRAIVWLRGDGEGVCGVSGVGAAGFVVKARHIAREVDVAWVAVAAVGAVVARAGVVDENLNVLVAIVLLLGIQADR